VCRKADGGENDRVHWWRGDLAEISTVRTLLDAVKADVIFHLASHVAGSRSPEMVLPTFRSNLASSVNILTVANDIGCRRIVMVGSMEEPNGGEEWPTPRSPYAAAKWASSGYGRMFWDLYRTPIVMARVFMTYGPGQRDLSKLIPYVMVSLLRGQTPKLTRGQRPVDWIFVDDVVEALLAAGQVPGVEGCTVDVGSGSLVPIRTVVEEIVNLMGCPVEPEFGALPDRAMEQVGAADTSPAFAKLAWKPLTPLREGLARTVAWYERHFHEVVQTDKQGLGMEVERGESR
jgi:nucleoside-diphosphate-sugar epimerase